jgi:hypothetical protein
MLALRGSEPESPRVRSVWHLASGRRFEVGREAEWVYAVAFAPDGRSLAAGNFHTLAIRQIER